MRSKARLGVPDLQALSERVADGRITEPEADARSTHQGPFVKHV